MFKSLTAALIVFGATTPVFAQTASAPQPGDIVVTGRADMRSIEFEYSGQERMQKARSMITGLFPAGSSIASAREELSKSGARCKPETPDGQMVCSYYGFEGVDDHLHDVVWTVSFADQKGTVAGVDVSRDSIGS